MAKYYRDNFDSPVDVRFRGVGAEGKFLETLTKSRIDPPILHRGLVYKGFVRDFI